MPGVRQSVFNVGGGESYVTGNDKLAAQHGDEMFRRMQLQQQAAAMQAQLYDNQQNRASQERLTGTAEQRFGYDSNLQRDRFAGENTIEGTRQGGMNTRTEMQMGPANAQTAMAQKLFDEQARVRGARGEAEMRDLDFNKSVDAQLSSLLAGGSSAPAAAPSKYTSLVGQGNEAAGVPHGQDDKLNTLVKIMAARQGRPVPSQYSEQLQKLDVEDKMHKRYADQALEARNAGDNVEADRIQQQHGVRLPSTVTPDSISAIVGQQLPDYINRDEAWFQGDPDQKEQDNLVQLYMQMVKAFEIQNGGNKELAKQQALAKFQEIGGASEQTTDARTDWFGGNTRDLFSRLK